MNTHTRSSGQPFMLWHPGSSWGFGALLKGTSVVVLRVERAPHSLNLQFLQARDSNSQPLGYKSDSLTIRPRLPQHYEVPVMPIFSYHLLKHWLLCFLLVAQGFSTLAFEVHFSAEISSSLDQTDLLITFLKTLELNSAGKWTLGARVENLWCS